MNACGVCADDVERDREAGFDKVIVTTAGGKFTHHYQFNSMMRITSVLKTPRDDVLATTQVRVGGVCQRA